MSAGGPRPTSFPLTIVPGIIISAVAYGVWRFAIKPEIGKYGSNAKVGLPEKKAN